MTKQPAVSGPTAQIIRQYLLLAPNDRSFLAKAVILGVFRDAARALAAGSTLNAQRPGHAAADV